MLFFVESPQSYYLVMVASNAVVDKVVEAEHQIFQQLQANRNGLSIREITDQTPLLSPEERVTLINRLTSSGDVELLTVESTNSTVLRYRKSPLPAGATREERTVSLVLPFRTIKSFRCTR